MRVPLRDRLPLLLVILAGTALRLVRLGAESLWYDETVSVTLAGSPLAELIRHTAGDIHPPGYYLLLRGWLTLAGYSDGRASATDFGLEHASAFMSLFFGVLLIALGYALAMRFAGRSVGLVAACLVAVSPYNVWYSQEVRMYTLGAVLAGIALYAMLRAAGTGGGARWWITYALAAAAGMYTLYYFAFFLVAVNLWCLGYVVATGRFTRATRESPFRGSPWWLGANILALALYAPWIPIALRQAIDPPVPPWRTGTPFFASLGQGLSSLVAGQSAPAWGWPVVAITVAIYAAGIWSLAGHEGSGSRFSRRLGLTLAHPLLLATFGSFFLILVASLATPLFHVRYVFTYSLPFYVVLAAGFVAVWRRRAAIGGVALAAWLAVCAISLRAFWVDPSFRPDDHRAAVHYLQSHWRPGDVLLVNAGYAYPVLQTYWTGPVPVRSRVTEPLPELCSDDALVMVTTGHVDGDPDLGWGDPLSDFYALPSSVAADAIESLYRSSGRVWHYRVYDTVNDPSGVIRAGLEAGGRLAEDRVFTGEANLRVQAFLPRHAESAEAAIPIALVGDRLALSAEPLPHGVLSGETLYVPLWWKALAGPIPDVATSIRLVDAQGDLWSQPPDEQPAGSLYRSSAWSIGAVIRQPLALPIPTGTPPGAYAVQLVVYDAATGVPWKSIAAGSAAPSDGPISLGTIMIAPAIGSPAEKALADFGPLALLSASTPATVLSGGASIPLQLLWEAHLAPAEPYVVVVQLLDDDGTVVASLEEEPLGGRYPSTSWASGEQVADRHTLAVPADLLAGEYRLIVGLYKASDGERLQTASGLFGASDHYLIKIVRIE